jgi:glycosyltransferase involved in cell wall biosynthesis
VANPHKGHVTLFKAALELARTGLSFQVVLTGHGTDGLVSGTPNGQPEIEEARRLLERNPELRSQVSCLGKVPDAAVEATYAGSNCVVLPSTYEGFGLPLSEALRHGVAIICADIPPFREQIQLYEAGDDAALFPPGDHRKLAQLMAMSLTHRPPRRTRREVSRRLARWTWDDVANRYVACLQL